MTRDALSLLDCAKRKADGWVNPRPRQFTSAVCWDFDQQLAPLHLIFQHWPVIDLAVRFGRAQGDASRRTCIVILEINQDEQQQEIGVVVDAVSAVLDMADADIEPPPKFGAKLRTDFISGMGKIDDKFVIILDVDKVLSIAELSMLDGISEGYVPALAAPEIASPI